MDPDNQATSECRQVGALHVAVQECVCMLRHIRLCYEVDRCLCRRHAALQQLESWVTKRYAYAEEARWLDASLACSTCTRVAYLSTCDGCNISRLVSRHRRLEQSPSSRSCWVSWVSSVQCRLCRHWTSQTLLCTCLERGSRFVYGAVAQMTLSRRRRRGSSQRAADQRRHLHRSAWQSA